MMELTLSAYEFDPFRMIRLARVASMLAGVRGLIRLHDHKGCLQVTWLTEPEPEERELVELVWREIGHEPQVEHELKDAEEAAHA
jgi:hypothetical protein